MNEFFGSSLRSRDDLCGWRRAMAFLFPALRSVVVLALLTVAGCEKPAEPEPDMPFPPPPPPAESPAVFVPIPEEFQTPPQGASQAPPDQAPPATPRILFITKEFQITNKSGIQGVQVGETVNLLRETDDEYIVQYGDLEFIKEKSFFSPTFVGRGAALPEVREPVTAAAGEPENPAQEATATPEKSELAAAPAGEGEEIIGLAAPVPAAEPALPDETPSSDPMRPPQMTAEEKRMADISDAIRGLNESIREAQQKAEAPGKKPSRAERRALDQMKEQRDELSRQLTTMGKP